MKLAMRVHSFRWRCVLETNNECCRKISFSGGRVSHSSGVAQQLQHLKNWYVFLHLQEYLGACRHRGEIMRDVRCTPAELFGGNRFKHDQWQLCTLGW
eukprot:6185154-Pleurochrysis_carterae.AAC.3